MSNKLKSYFSLHFNIPSVIIILLIIVVVYKPTASFIRLEASNAAELKGAQDVLKDLAVNILSDILAALIIGGILFFILNLRHKSSLAGKFKAYDIKITETNAGGTITKVESKEEWGSVKLTYNLFTNDLRGCLTNKDGKTEIEIEAKFQRGEYLRGHYIESTAKTRRRMGAFLLMLDGNGNDFRGKYVFVDPDKNNFSPQFGEAEWVKE